MEDYISEYDKIELKHLIEFKEAFFKRLRFEFLICGHLDEDQAKDICATIQNSFEHDTLPAEEKFQKKKMVLISESKVLNLNVSAQVPLELDPNNGKVI